MAETRFSNCAMGFKPIYGYTENKPKWEKGTVYVEFE